MTAVLTARVSFVEAATLKPDLLVDVAVHILQRCTDRSGVKFAAPVYLERRDGQSRSAD